jgi:segregation and condensation protein B
MVPLAAKKSRRLYMSKRALEFVETWVSEKIEEEGVPKEGQESPAKEWAAECVEAANEEGIPALEINEAFDDLAEFIDGEIEEAREREEDEDEDEDEEEDDEEFEDDDDDDDDDEEEEE